jgi:serine/threonine protein kinase
MQPTTGDELAGYRLEALAGRGGMGEVYRAVDDRLGRSVALKLLPAATADDPTFRERFLRESRLAARLDHPNVIPVYEAGEADRRLFIAMRYVEGTDLRQLLRETAILEPARALSLLAPVGLALDAAHARGLVHRDVKPGNILIAVEPAAEPAEHVYLSDFGLSTLFADGADGGFSGTADYAAPELITRDGVDGRADVYSLGCVLFECLTGRPPYQGASQMAVLWAHLSDPAPAATAVNPSLPPAVDGVLRRALAKEPGQRHATCRELVEDVRDALGVTGVDLPAGGRPQRVLAAGVLIGAAAVVAALLTFFLTRGSGSPALAAGGALVRIDPATGEPARPPTTRAVATTSTTTTASRRRTRPSRTSRSSPTTSTCSSGTAVGRSCTPSSSRT